MNEERYNRIRQKLDEQFLAAQAEYRKNIDALDRVIALEQLLPPDADESAVEEADDPLVGLGLETPPSRTSLLTEADVAEALAEAMSARRGEVLDTINSVIPDLPEQFTWRTVDEHIRRIHPGTVFREHSVRQAMARCVELGSIRLLKQGQGRAPSIYTRSPNSVDEVFRRQFEEDEMESP